MSDKFLPEVFKKVFRYYLLKLGIALALSIGPIIIISMAVGLFGIGVNAVGFLAIGFLGVGFRASGLCVLSYKAKSRGRYVFSPARQDTAAIALFTRWLPRLKGAFSSTD